MDTGRINTLEDIGVGDPRVLVIEDDRRVVPFSMGVDDVRMVEISSWIVFLIGKDIDFIYIALKNNIKKLDVIPLNSTIVNV